MGVRQRRSWRFSADSRQRVEHFPAGSLRLRKSLDTHRLANSLTEAGAEPLQALESSVRMTDG